jgi:hypothetical protein
MPPSIDTANSLSPARCGLTKNWMRPEFGPPPLATIDRTFPEVIPCRVPILYRGNHM